MHQKRHFRTRQVGFSISAPAATGREIKLTSDTTPQHTIHLPTSYYAKKPRRTTDRKAPLFQNSLSLHQKRTSHGYRERCVTAEVFPYNKLFRRVVSRSHVLAKKNTLPVASCHLFLPFRCEKFFAPVRKITFVCDTV
jgi:hypothetical protein